jgi:copper transport protein
VRRLLALLALAFVAVVALAPPASAHAELLSTTPTDGQLFAEPPTELVARFSQRVQIGAGLQLHDSAGERVDRGGVESLEGGRTLRLPLGPLDPGSYVFSWRVVSADGHPISGGITFQVGSEQEAAMGDAERAEADALVQDVLDAELDDDDAVVITAGVVRALLFAVVLLVVGALVFSLAAWPAALDDRRVRRMVVGAAGVGIVATALGMGLQGAEVAGLGIDHAFRPSVAWDTTETDFGRLALARMALLAVVAVLVVVPARLRSRPWQVVTVGASAAVLATLTYSGHARSGRWLALAAPVDLVHLGAAAVWLGGLATVLVVRDRDGIAARFSRLAWWAMVTIVVTGTVQGVRQVGSVDALTGTTYGKALVVKVIVVAVLLTIAGYARSVLGEQRSLRRAVGIEAVLAVVVLGVTSVLVAADPTKAADEEAFARSVAVQGTIIEVLAAPARPGPVDFHIYVTDPTVGLTTPLALEATVTTPSGDDRAVPVRPAGRTHWSAFDVELAAAGTYRVEVVLTIGTGTTRRAVVNVPID